MTRASFFIIMSFNLISLFIWQGLPRDPLQRFTLCSQLAQAGARVFFRVSFTENKKKRGFVVFPIFPSVCLIYLFRRRRSHNDSRWAVQMDAWHRFLLSRRREGREAANCARHASFYRPLLALCAMIVFYEKHIWPPASPYTTFYI